MWRAGRDSEGEGRWLSEWYDLADHTGLIGRHLEIKSTLERASGGRLALAGLVPLSTAILCLAGRRLSRFQEDRIPRLGIYPSFFHFYTVPIGCRHTALQLRRRQSLEDVIMKSLIKAVAIAVVLAAPVASFAQSNQPLTRAEVKAQLVQLEKAGYNPALVNDAAYPSDIQAAEARVAAENSATRGVGGAVSGSSDSGAAAVRQ